MTSGEHHKSSEKIGSSYADGEKRKYLKESMFKKSSI